jgi:hypothetical protein
LSFFCLWHGNQNVFEDGEDIVNTSADCILIQSVLHSTRSPSVAEFCSAYTVTITYV